jgi:hypothetical protein
VASNSRERGDVWPKPALPIKQTPSILFHEIFDTDLSAVKMNKIFSKILRVFGCDDSFFAGRSSHRA